MSAIVATQQPVGYLDERSRLLSAVVAQLSSLDRRHGGYLEYLGEYAGELGVRALETGIFQQLLGRAPAVLATIGDASYANRSARRLRSRASYDVEILVIAKHMRSRVDQAMAQSAYGDPGAFQIIHDVRDCLMGWQLSVEHSGVMSPQTETALIADENLSVWQCTYSIEIEAHQLTPQERAIHPALVVDSDFNLVGGNAANPVAETESIPDEED